MFAYMLMYYAILRLQIIVFIFVCITNVFDLYHSAKPAAFPIENVEEFKFYDYNI